MSFPTYPALKESRAEWLGAIPKHWETRRIRRLFDIKKRIAGVDGFDILSITQSGIRVKDTESNDGQISLDYTKYQIVEVGDFAMNGMDLLTGYVDISTRYGVTSPDYRVFSIKRQAECFDRFYLYLFQMGYKNKIFYAFGQGSSQLGRWRFPTDQFNDFIFPYPPVLEQIHIATFLDRETGKIDALVEEQELLVELLKEKRQAVISHAVTKGLDPNAPMKDSGVEWLGDVPAHWESSPLKYLASVKTGFAFSSDDFVTEGVPVLRIGDITIEGGIDFSNARFLPIKFLGTNSDVLINSTDIVMAMTGATIGKSGWYFNDEPAFLNQRVCVFRAKQTDSQRYLWYVLKTAFYAEHIALGAVGGAQPNISDTELLRCVVPVPPMADRVAVATFLDEETERFQSLITQAETAIALLQERRSALISAVVTGKIDVRALVNAEAEAA